MSLVKWFVIVSSTQQDTDGSGSLGKKNQPLKFSNPTLEGKDDLRKIIKKMAKNRQKKIKMGRKWRKKR